MAGKLYLVSTPIGNLGDITLRAIDTLKNADVVLAEDTRVTGKLLAHLGVKKPLISYHEHSDNKKHEHVLELVKNGQNAALCSDAGMPCISDPGQELVADAIVAGIEVVPIPGANAMLTGLIASGVSTDTFTFMGFFPRKKREDSVRLVMDRVDTVIFYESPMRICDTVNAIAAVIPDRDIVVARELTKLHEEFIRGKADEVARNLASRESIKGEMVVIISPAVPQVLEHTDEDIAQLISQRMVAGDTAKSAVAAVAKEHSLPKNRVYDAYLNFLKGE